MRLKMIRSSCFLRRICLQYGQPALDVEHTIFILYKHTIRFESIVKSFLTWRRRRRRSYYNNDDVYIGYFKRSFVQYFFVAYFLLSPDVVSSAQWKSFTFFDCSHSIHSSVHIIHIARAHVNVCCYGIPEQYATRTVPCTPGERFALNAINMHKSITFSLIFVSQRVIVRLLKTT